MADSTPTAVQAPPDESTKSRSRGPAAKGIIIAVVAVLVLAWLSASGGTPLSSEDTDDAQVNGHLIQVSSRIAGQVLKVYVEENQQVNKGDPIAELDPRDFQVAVENAKAALASAKANAAAAQVNVPITTINTGSNLSSADADVSGAQRRRFAGGSSNWPRHRRAWRRPRPTTPRRRRIWRATSRWSRKT